VIIDREGASVYAPRIAATNDVLLQENREKRDQLLANKHERIFNWGID
jgi:hypothetical protein